MRSAAEAKLNQWGMSNLNPDSLMADLNLADRQHVEIVSALSREPKLLVLDEPTAALPDPEWLYRQIAVVTGRGTSVIYISHKLAEIRKLCDHGTVLRNGHVVGSFTKNEMDEQELIQLMIGRSFVQAFPAKRPVAAETQPLLAVRKLVALPRLNGVDLSLGRSEVVGVAGLEGQGQRELFYALAGLVSWTGGDVKLHAQADEHTRKERRFSAKRPDFVLVPEERKTEALFMQMGTRYNLTISRVKEFRHWLYVRRSAEHKFARAAATKVNMTAAALDKPVAALSGGNQQKVVFGRSLLSKPRCLILFDPTRGVDAATKMDIYRMIRDYAEAGDGVLIYSTEIPELVGLCDRVYTIYNGKIQAELSGDQITEKALMNSALGRQREESLL